MRVLRKGDTGEDVKTWQFFLIGKGFLKGLADGIFGQKTLEATINFQRKFKLLDDGMVGNKTIGVAMKNGFMVAVDENTDKNSPNWPPPPKFKSLYSQTERDNLFGKFSYKHAPTKLDSEAIQITDNWEKINIIDVHIPQLAKIKFPVNPMIKVHRKCAEQMKNLWSEWEKQKLLGLVLSYYGCYYPRFIRGSRTVLSNHAYGSAFDINVPQNLLGHMPALVGKLGSVRELVPIANDLGFYWGGHFSRQDGMHFEVAKIL